ncbi:hypothetical protein [uncultured Jannaschia sp.]|nr:hypothetical protein [uncultured Jannaschia sp.]
MIGATALMSHHGIADRSRPHKEQTAMNSIFYIIGVVVVVVAIVSFVL